MLLKIYIVSENKSLLPEAWFIKKINSFIVLKGMTGEILINQYLMVGITPIIKKGFIYSHKKTKNMYLWLLLLYLQNHKHTFYKQKYIISIRVYIMYK